MRRKTKQKLLRGCVAALTALSSALPAVFMPASVYAAATATNVPSAYTRIGGADQYATAALMARQGWPQTADNVVLSAGMNNALVDALAAGPLAAELKAPILLTDGGDSLNPSAKAEIQRLKPKKVYLTSGTAVIKPSVIEELKAMNITPVSLGGYDQYETSVNIAKEMASQGADVSRVILAAGWVNPADALSVAPIAAAQGMPVLTTTKNQLPASVKAYLDTIKTKVTDSYVVGGSAVVSDTVQGELPGKVSRYSGLTKYDTNVQILTNFVNDYRNDTVYVANGETLVDALAGVPLAAASNSPFVLVDRQLEKTTKDFVKSTMSAAKMVVLGGEAVVPSAEINSLTSTVAYSADNAVEGSADAAKPVELTDNVKISGSNVTLQNAKADYSVYVQGDKATLSNLKVLGTVFVDPGDNGSAVLDGVTAAKIIILSGAQDTIRLNNTKADALIVDSRSSDVHVESTGTTAMGSSVIRSSALVDAVAGTLGKVTILKGPNQNPTVELGGTFSQPVVINSEAQVHLNASAAIEDLITNAQASLIVDQGAKVTHFDNQGYDVVLSGSGAKAIPQSSTTSAGSSASGGQSTSSAGSSGSSDSTTPAEPETVKVSNLRVITNPSNLLGSYDNGDEIDLSGLDNSVKILGFAVTADHDCTLQIKALNETQNISLKAGQERVVTAGDLSFGVEVPDGVSLGDFRALYAKTKTKTLQGSLLIDGKSAGLLTVKLRFLN